MTPENSRKIESLLQEVSTILLSENLVRGGAWSFNGWTSDGHAITHKIAIGGYERTGPTVEREHLTRPSATSPSVTPPPSNRASDERLHRILRRLRAGAVPRISLADFERLHALVPNALQRESAHGADRSGGYVLTCLRSATETDAAIDAYFARQMLAQSN